MPQEPYYITTAIFYPNAKPHMGHALELVQADFLARYHRMYSGKSVRFQTGLDEHGMKMQRTAEVAGMDPATFVKEQSKTFEAFVSLLHASPDRFIRTTDQDHNALASAFWLRCVEKGDIYKKMYRAWYDVKEETFLGSADQNPDPKVFGVDEKFIELIEEENYFFACSKYSNKVLEILESGQYEVVPDNRRLEMVNFIKDKGLADVSISREKNKLSWGIPVPQDPEQVMYVWFDALTNYLTGASNLTDKGEIVTDAFWPASLHCVGKDIARFHALLWPSMLLSAGIELPKRLLVHGFVLSEGRKMSKSLGNGVDPVEMVEKYGVDALRWFLLSAMPTQDDGDFTEERLQQIYASDLANDYGNLVSRVITMCHKYSNGQVPSVTYSEKSGKEIMKAWDEYSVQVGMLRLENACEVARNLVLLCNKKIDEYKPWVMAKDPTQKDQLDALLHELLETILHITLMVAPAMPDTAKRVISDVYCTTIEALIGGSMGRVEWGLLSSGSPIGPTGIQLFPRMS